MGVESKPGQGSRFWFRARVGHVAPGADRRKVNRVSPDDAPAAARALDWVGMSNIALPIRVATAGGDPIQVAASVDVAVDLRRSSPNFGKWVGAMLSADNKQQLWIPPGFAHGFVVLSDTADFLYKTTDYYAPKHERSIAWNDPAIGITWPPGLQPQLTTKDQNAKLLAEAELF